MDIDKSKAARDGTLASSVLVLAAFVLHPFHLPAEVVMAGAAVATFLAPFGYRIVRHNWPWLAAKDPEPAPAPPAP